MRKQGALILLIALRVWEIHWQSYVDLQETAPQPVPHPSKSLQRSPEVWQKGQHPQQPIGTQTQQGC